MDENYQGLQFDEIKQRISQYCSFSLGKEKLLASKPSFNRLVVQLVNNRLKQAINMAVSYGPMPFGGIYDITSEVLLAQKNAVLNPNELLKVASQAYGIKQIYDGSFSGKLIEGKGVFAEMLSKAGIKIIDVEELTEQLF